MQPPYPRPIYANYALLVLLLAYINSFVDRNVFAILVGPIREQFGISDFQFSILHGWAFTLFYIGLGLPIGWLADRVSRRMIMSWGLFFWSLMTCACGLVRTLPGLFAARIGVGVGEATLSPPAYSMLSDYFPPEKLRWATATFTLGITLGSGLSYMIGGWLYDLFSDMDLSGVWLLAELAPWQLTFIAVGAPGFLIVLMMLLIKEPPRRHLPTEAVEAPPLKQVGQFMRGRWQVYTALMMGISMMSVIGYGTLAWYPEFLVRTYGLERGQAGGYPGMIFMFAGTAGSLSGAAIATVLQRMGYRDANMRMIMLAAIILTPLAIAAPLMPDARLALLLTVPVIFFHYTHFGVGMAALQIITPNRMRAQTTAVLLFLTNLFGMALGGSVVAGFTDFVFRSDGALYLSLATVAAIVYPAAALLIAWGLRHYRAALPVLSPSPLQNQAPGDRISSSS